VLSSRTLQFDHFLRGVQLSYHGNPRVDADEVERRIEQAYLEGQEATTSVFNNQILSQRTEVQQLLGETLEAINAKVDRCLREVFEEIPGLVTNIARRVLAGIELDGPMVDAVVRELISDLPSIKERIHIYLNDKDLRILESYAGDLPQRYANCIFVADPELGPADCRVTSSFGTIDGRVSTKLKHIEDQLRT
jgi:flagellar biosynthesis/type III secretory pathway protein FliH